jgi:lysophospholipase L1-like esterase
MPDNHSPEYKFPTWYRRLLLSVVSVLITLIAVEIGLRIGIGAVFPNRFFEPHEQFGHFHVPGRTGWQHTAEYNSYIVINSKGLRDRERPYAKPDGTFRILMVGDSFVEGIQVDQDQTLPAQLEALLNRQSGTPIEVINAGVSRYATDNVLLFLESEGLRYQPDLVIYAFFPNDVVEIQENNLFELVDGQPIQHRVSISLVDRARLFLYDYSYLYRFARGLSIRMQHESDTTLIRTELGKIHPTYRAELRPEEAYAWDLIACLLERMVSITTESGAKFVVVSLPEDFQSEDRLWERVEQSDEPLLRDAPNRMLAKAVPEGIPYFDLLPDFRVAAQAQTLYYPMDHHFNPAGQALAAELIASFLVAENLVPSS